MTVRILRGILIAVAVSVTAYWQWLRPEKRNWGASDAEIRRPLPGDALLPAPQLEATRAITIHAPPTRVWPWLLQIGQGRGGFYSYDWLENLAGCGVRSATRIHPEWQKLDVGDVVRAHATLPIGWLVRRLRTNARWSCRPRTRTRAKSRSEPFPPSTNSSGRSFSRPSSRATRTSSSESATRMIGARN